MYMLTSGASVHCKKRFVIFPSPETGQSLTFLQCTVSPCAKIPWFFCGLQKNSVEMPLVQCFTSDFQKGETETKNLKLKTADNHTWHGRILSTLSLLLLFCKFSLNINNWGTFNQRCIVLKIFQEIDIVIYSDFLLYTLF